MKSLFFTLDGHMVPASVNVSLNGDGNYYAPIERECNECAGTGHKGLMYVKSVMGANSWTHY